MGTRLFSRGVAVVAVFIAFIFATSNTSLGESSKQETMMVLNELQYNVTIKGDNLTRLAGRFGVSKESVLKANPTLAARTNPSNRYWLYVGETLVIPVYQTQVKNPDEIGNATIVAVPMRAIREKDGNIERALYNVSTLEQFIREQAGELQHALETGDALKTKVAQLESEKVLFILAIAILLVVILYSGIFLVARQSRISELEKFEQEKVQETAPPSPGVSSRVSGMAEELVEISQNLSINEVARFTNLKILEDECGNSITIKKLSRFLAKRPHLVGLTLEECKEKMLVQRLSSELHTSPHMW